MFKSKNILFFMLSMMMPLLLAACSDEAPSAAGQDEDTAVAQAQKEDWTSQGSASVQDHSSASPAEALFVEKCAMCHRQLGMGTVLLSRRVDPAKAMLEDRDDLNADYVTTVVRMGLGNMPPISRGEVSDGQLDTIASYLAKEGAQ